VAEPNANRVYRNALFVQRVSIGLAVAVQFGAFDLGFLRNRRQLSTVKANVLPNNLPTFPACSGFGILLSNAARV
jgi:hypothetical protein